MTKSHPQFATTQWTLVWKAAEEDSRHGRPALAEVIRRYWQPLYSFARKQGLPSQDAEDATQEFLGGVIDGRWLERADPAKGKFRTYLLACWKRFLVDQYRQQNAQRRGGQAVLMSLDVSSGEQKWLELRSKEPDPDRIFMRSWANSLLDEVQQRLRIDYQAKDRCRVLDALLPCLTQPLTAERAIELADELGMSTGGIKVALHRLRQRYGQALRDVVSETVEDPADVDAELSELLGTLVEN